MGDEGRRTAVEQIFVRQVQLSGVHPWESRFIKNAAYRLSIILRKNNRWMGCSSKTDIDEIDEQWRTYMLGASAYLEKYGVDQTAEALNRPLEITMTFWWFQEPSLKHLHDMTHLALVLILMELWQPTSNDAKTRLRFSRASKKR